MANVTHALATLIEASGAALTAQTKYYREVFEPHEQHEINARASGGEPSPVPDEVERQNAALEDALYATEKEVALYPAATPSDFYAKTAFMVERQMFDSAQIAATLLADAARLAGQEMQA